MLTKIKGEKTMPTETGEKYECEICGAVVVVEEGGAGTWNVADNQ
ncbi:MAG: Desulfoferrodoxin [Candidatus Scalindua rubra]|uniref:Desulfoferrodoxin n=1 Tax=Candidatus Scalindua rubra TaxID=1872076 RepID=A0A1E3XCD5_9BACT|nr:MAG: Desulfoferrodoxin [Candidatus Scalindua rubra]